MIGQQLRLSSPRVPALLSLLLCSALCASCADGLSARTEEARLVLAGLSPEEKAGQVIMTAVERGDSSESDNRAFIAELKPGAAILFGFNVSAGIEATRKLTADIQDALPPGYPAILVAIDHEGGRVWRFGNDLTRLPSALSVGDRLDAAGRRELGDIAGRELSALGIRLDLGPVVEPLSPWNEAFLGDRSFSSDPRRAADAAADFARGLSEGGVGACYKHYPANADSDPHKSLPRLDAPASSVRERALVPFRRAMGEFPPDALMLSHVVVDALDPDRPASLSPRVIGLLKSAGYEGIVLTDDVLMTALAKDAGPGDSAVEALRAGADMVMVTAPSSALRVRNGILAALKSGRLPASRLDDACLRVIRVKLARGLQAERDPAFRDRAMAALPAALAEGRIFVTKAFGKAEN